MTRSNLPPQAYTKEDIAKAFVWVQTQPDFVKNMATSKEALVALYLQARRNGVSSLEHNIVPASTRDFQSQLQSLAGELNQFEKEKKTYIPSAPLNPSAPQIESNEVQSPERFNDRNLEFKVTEKITERQTIQSQGSLLLNPRSQELVNSVKAQLNMDSDADIVKMLIELGYERLKTIFPNRE
jgi:hypothetical protein